MRKKTHRVPVFIISFGVGLIVAFYCPLRVLVLLLAIVIIYLGICSLKC